MNFDGPSIQSSVSSSYSLNSYNAPNKKPKQSKPHTHTSGNLSIVREHSHSSFTDNSFTPRSENHRPPSRFLKISGLPKTAEPASIVDTLSAFGELRGIYSREISLNGSVIVAFYDLRHSVTAYKSLCSQSIMGHVLQPQFFPKNYLIQMSENGIDMPFSTEYDDELTIFFNPGSVEDARSVLENYLPRFGSVLSLKIESDTTISCEFFDLRHAAAAADNIDGNVIRDITFYVSYQSIDYAFCPTTECNDFDKQPGSSALARVSSMPATTRRSTLSVHAPVFEAGAYGRRSPLPFGVYSDVDPAEASLTFQVENAPTSGRYDVYTNATVPKNNVVDLERIARGLDTRTTLMLRNIPNKVDQRMLKDYIDVTNRGTYDFLYLRIDFLNKCNVGYAFISFTSPEAIITFAKARAGTKWNRFNSEKICDISYANIQGKECLIEKFRNSSVMDQDAAYRPKIYYSDGPHKGEEEEFPPPNNLNRKLRSIASIQQIGI
ncbi:RNA recognition motif 2-domain-containing protein [Myxozyma melibiosi]|uniref:RNA recognition motif 2-domain-containing protein n=1 Tax=Myxozyma melibiosi TaxID=54550 RepID=A0ABR1F9W5_9ASCO